MSKPTERLHPGPHIPGGDRERDLSAEQFQAMARLWRHAKPLTLSRTSAPRCVRHVAHIKGDDVKTVHSRPRKGFVGTGIDVTEQEQLEGERDRMRQLEAELAHISRVSMLGEMAASLAHEIKQPIAAAITSANSCMKWLAHEPPNLDRARAAAAKVDKYGNRAAETIDYIRSFCKKSPPQRALVDVNGIVHEILALLRANVPRTEVLKFQSEQARSQY